QWGLEVTSDSLDTSDIRCLDCELRFPSDTRCPPCRTGNLQESSLDESVPCPHAHRARKIHGDQPMTTEMSDVRQLPTGGRVADRAVAEIRRFIESNDLQAGHKLPPERVFIEQLGVSRSSVREALRVLSTMGLIEVRHGDGMYVAQAP